MTNDDKNKKIDETIVSLFFLNESLRGLSILSQSEDKQLNFYFEAIRLFPHIIDLTENVIDNLKSVSKEKRQ